MTMEEVYVLGVKSELLEVLSQGTTRTVSLTGDWDQMTREWGQGKGYFYRLGSSRFLTLGLESTQTSVFYVSAGGREGNVVQLSRLREVRVKPGVIDCSNHAYIFGGFDESGLELKNSAERLLLSSRVEELAIATWEPLPNMIHPRASFLPCLLNKEIYLCGGFTRYCEVYSPDEETYRDLPISLREFDARSHLAVFVNETIVILSRRWVMLWLPGKKETSSYEIDAVVDPYSSGGVKAERILLSDQSRSDLLARGYGKTEESWSCNLYYVYRGQFVCVTLPTRIGS